MPQFLVIQLARFGDLVQSKRLIRTLEGRGTVHLCIDPSLAGVAALLYPDAVVHPLPVHRKPDAQSLAMTRATCAALASAGFDAVYNLNHAGFNRALARLFAPELVRGHTMCGGQALRSPWVRGAFRWTRQRVLAPVNLVDFWAWFDPAPCDAATVNPAARGQGRGVGVVLAGRESRRSLPPPLLARCVQTVFEAMGGPDVFLLGSASESPLARQLLRQLPPRVGEKTQDLSGKTSWQGLADALAGLDVLLSPDTGTMHLAAHLGVPVQAFFLSSAWCYETGPYGLGHTVWQSAYECAPCLESAPCPLNTACLRDFESTALLRGLTRSVRGQSLGAAAADGGGRSCDAPSLLCCRSVVDGLGLFWQSAQGSDPHALRRQALRALVAEARGVPLPENLRPEVREWMRDETLLEMVHDAADWMLPPWPPCPPYVERSDI